MKNILQLTDSELHNASGGTASVELIREIIEQEGKDSVINNTTGLLDTDQFAQWFAYGLEDLIDAEPTSEEWQQGWRSNYEWGLEIAERINLYVRA